MNIPEEHQLGTLQEALRASFIDCGQLWDSYAGLGGRAGDVEVEAHIHGLMALPPQERNLLAAAANELIDALPPLPRATFSNGSAPSSLAATPASSLD